MPRLEPHTVETAPEGAREALTRPVVTTPARIYAYWPPLLHGADAMAQALEKDRQLPEALIRLVKLRAAQLAGCPF